jgi:hypothetical protein
VTLTPVVPNTFTSTVTLTPVVPNTFTRTATLTPVVPNTFTRTATLTPVVPNTFTRTATSTATRTVTRTATPQVPVLGSLGTAPAAGVAATLAVNGTTFVNGAQVLLDGFGITTTFMSTGLLDASLPALAAGTYSISVRNPAGETSGSMSLVIIAGPAPTATFTATLTPAGPAAPTAVSGGGTLIVETRPFPNPNPRCVSVLLSADADSLELKVYTTAMQAIGTCKHGPALAGWVQVSLPVEMKAGGSAGLYYYSVTAQRNGSTAKAPHSGKLIIIK